MPEEVAAFNVEVAAYTRWSCRKDFHQKETITSTLSCALSKLHFMHPVSQVVHFMLHDGSGAAQN